MRLRLAVVGDIHDQWEDADRQALEQLAVDLVLFVGDFGNEAVEVVRAIAALPLPKAAILGNHDAWYTASAWGKRKRPSTWAPDDRVQQQLDLLGDAHVGYGAKHFPQWQLSVVGSRPFSWGGSEWKNDEFYRERFGVQSFAESTARMVAAAAGSPYDTILMLAHNGPYGLGALPSDPCGKDWDKQGGDFGDPDLTDAIAAIRALPRQIPLVAFGHMHHHLFQGGDRRRALHVTGNTIHLNAASFPRHVPVAGGNRRNFTLVTLVSGNVGEVALVWLNPDYSDCSCEVLYRA